MEHVLKLDARPVRPKDQVTFHCDMCGRCCRHLTEKLMVESLDAYRIAKYLRDEKRQSGMTIGDVYARYTTAIAITAGYPICVMKTTGPEDACVFLKDGRCSIYPARPRACRLYPFSVGPGERGRDFNWYLSLDDPMHLSGGHVLVKDWMYQNFTREDREFVKREYETVPLIGAILRALDRQSYKRALILLLCYRYDNISLDEPFMPQYERNFQSLMQQLAELADHC